MKSDFLLTHPISEGYPLLRRGMYTIVNHQVKGGNREFTIALIASLIDKGRADFGIKKTEDKPLKVLYVNTTDVEYELSQLCKDVRSDDNADTLEESLNVVSLRLCETEKRIGILQKAAEYFHPDAILIDSIDDFVTDHNDQKQSAAVVMVLISIAMKNKAAVVTFMRKNDTSHTEGHLGSGIERKSRDVLTIESSDSRYFTNRKVYYVTSDDGFDLFLTNEDGKVKLCDIEGDTVQVVI